MSWLVGQFTKSFYQVIPSPFNTCTSKAVIASELSYGAVHASITFTPSRVVVPVTGASGTSEDLIVATSEKGPNP